MHKCRLIHAYPLRNGIYLSFLYREITGVLGPGASHGVSHLDAADLLAYLHHHTAGAISSLSREGDQGSFFIADVGVTDQVRSLGSRADAGNGDLHKDLVLLDGGDLLVQDLHGIGSGKYDIGIFHKASPFFLFYYVHCSILTRRVQYAILQTTGTILQIFSEKKVFFL